MVPAKARRRHRDDLQRRRSRSGADWEAALCEELDALPHAWARRWPKAWAGQPFDISAEIDGHAFAIECKSIARGNLPFSALRPSEVENLSRFEDAGGIAVIAVRRMEPPAQVFVPGTRCGRASWPATGAASRWRASPRHWPMCWR